MKPQDLRVPCSWEKRHPFIHDRIFFVPSYYTRYQEFSFPDWSASLLFGNTHPVSIEYGSGNGDWIIERALQTPSHNWVAVEKEYDRVRKIWSKCHNHQLQNLFIICGEAYTFTQHYLASGSMEAIFINFPDPWPKNKHRKHRLMQTAFLDELARVLGVGKQLTFVSDDPDYLATTHKQFAQHTAFIHASYGPLPEAYGTSWFEQLWRKKGKTIHYVGVEKA